MHVRCLREALARKPPRRVHLVEKHQSTLRANTAHTSSSCSHPSNSSDSCGSWAREPPPPFPLAMAKALDEACKELEALQAKLLAL